MRECAIPTKIKAIIRMGGITRDYKTDDLIDVINKDSQASLYYVEKRIASIYAISDELHGYILSRFDEGRVFVNPEQS